MTSMMGDFRDDVGDESSFRVLETARDYIGYDEKYDFSQLDRQPSATFEDISTSHLQSPQRLVLQARSIVDSKPFHWNPSSLDTSASPAVKQIVDYPESEESEDEFEAATYISPVDNPFMVGSESHAPSPGFNHQDYQDDSVQDLCPSVGSSQIRDYSPLFEPMDVSNENAPKTTSINMTKRGPHRERSRPRKPKGNLLHARSMKANIEANGTGVSLFKKNNRRKKVEDDPVNHLIKDLRQNHNMEWGAIANVLNEECIKDGKPPTFTQPAVYSRFVRNAPRIAAAEGEVGFDPKDYMYLRHPHHYVRMDVQSGEHANSPGNLPKRGKPETANKKRDGAECASQVRKRASLAQDMQELEMTSRTELLVQAVEKVQDNFWLFVANELERSSGKLYDEKAIESRYRAL